MTNVHSNDPYHVKSSSVCLHFSFKQFYHICSCAKFPEKSIARTSTSAAPIMCHFMLLVLLLIFSFIVSIFFLSYSFSFKWHPPITFATEFSVSFTSYFCYFSIFSVLITFFLFSLSLL